MESLVVYVISAFSMIIIVLGALLLFPFFPMLSLCIVLLCILAAAIITTATEKTENEVERAKA